MCSFLVAQLDAEMGSSWEAALSENLLFVSCYVFLLAPLLYGKHSSLSIAPRLENAPVKFQSHTCFLLFVVHYFNSLSIVCVLKM